MNMEWNSGWTITPPLLSFCRDFCLLFINLYLSTCICHRSKSCIFYRMVEKVWVVIFSPNTLNIYIQLCLVLFKIIFIFFCCLCACNVLWTHSPYQLPYFPPRAFDPLIPPNQTVLLLTPSHFLSLMYTSVHVCVYNCIYVCVYVYFASSVQVVPAVVHSQLLLPCQI